MDANSVLDCLGLYCPMPIIQTKERIDEIKEGDVLEVISDDKGVVPDMKAWCKSTGHKLLGIEEDDGECHVFVRKVA